MLTKICRMVCCLLGLLMVAVMAHAGGVDPRDMPTQERVREIITATPAKTSAAVSKARRAVVPVVEVVPVVKKAPVVKKSSVVKEMPVVEEVQMNMTRPKAASSASKTSSDSWLLGSREGSCAPLTSVSKKVKVGTFKTPQEFGRQLQQRGYQAFVLDIGDVRDQVVRVKVPDLGLDLTFVKAGMCR